MLKSKLKQKENRPSKKIYELTKEGKIVLVENISTYIINTSRFVFNINIIFDSK
ncbi:MAG: hypothetical protein HY934_07450 [Candidatus Firestonebacteria bacterium]|nr:hypothetical protein [Candidatus Firestonebacteria bacterium]